MKKNNNIRAMRQIENNRNNRRAMKQINSNRNKIEELEAYCHTYTARINKLVQDIAEMDESIKKFKDKALEYWDSGLSIEANQLGKERLDLRSARDIKKVELDTCNDKLSLLNNIFNLWQVLISEQEAMPSARRARDAQIIDIDYLKTVIDTPRGMAYIRSLNDNLNRQIAENTQTRGSIVDMRNGIRHNLHASGGRTEVESRSSGANPEVQRLLDERAEEERVRNMNIHSDALGDADGTRVDKDKLTNQ